MYDDYNNGGVYSGQQYEYSGSSTGSNYSTYSTGSTGSGLNGDDPNGNKKKEKKKGGFFVKVATALALGLVFGAAAGGAFQLVNYFTDYGDKGEEAAVEQTIDEVQPAEAEKTADATTDTTADDTTAVQTSVSTITDVSGIVDEVMPSVVTITGTYEVTQQNFFGQVYKQESSGGGSGIILAQNDDSLLIATNNHVVADSTDLQVQFIDGSSATANIKGTDEDMDLAVITVKLSDLSSSTKDAIAVAKLGDSDELKVGDGAIAIGNALGYGQSVTTGVISALDRTVTSTNSTTGDSTTVSGLIQTDAAINPGNSGGALLNMQGEVIGINSSKIGGTTVDGVGFAIPISAANPILSDIVSSSERVQVSESNRGYLGISGVTVTEEASQMYGMPVGVQVRKIYDNASAASSDMQPGDIIKKLGSKTIESMEELQEELSYYESGESVNLTAYRFVDGEYQEVTYSVVLSAKDQLE